MKRILPTLIVLAVLFGLVKLFRVVQQYDPSLRHGVGRDPLENVSVRFEGAHIVSRDAGVPQWSVKADRIDLKRMDYGGLDSFSGADFIGIKDGVLYREGRREAGFSARQASYSSARQQFDIRGAIRLTSEKGDQLEAEQCLWSEREDSVRLEQGMHGVIDGNKISAPYVLFAPRKRTVNCPQGAEATLGGYPIRASNLIWDVNAGHLHCIGPVSGERRSYSFTAASADVYLDRKTGAAAVKTPGEARAKPSVARVHAVNGTALLRIDSDAQGVENLGDLEKQ